MEGAVFDPESQSFLGARAIEKTQRGLLDGEHILGYPVPGALDDLTPGRRRFSFVWYRPAHGRSSG